MPRSRESSRDTARQFAVGLISYGRVKMLDRAGIGLVHVADLERLTEAEQTFALVMAKLPEAFIADLDDELVERVHRAIRRTPALPRSIAPKKRRAASG